MFEADIKPSMNAKDTFAILESTGFGRQGFFYEHWRGSVKATRDTVRSSSPSIGRRSITCRSIVGTRPRTRCCAQRLHSARRRREKFNLRVEKEENFSIPKEFWNFHRIGMLAAKRGQFEGGIHRILSAHSGAGVSGIGHLRVRP